MWCLETILEAQELYISAFFALKARNYYDGWCKLADAEVLLEFLAPHYLDLNHEYHVLFMTKQIALLQSLFPYRTFASAEILHTKVRCSICKQELRIRHPCGHRVGRLYDGQMCVREVLEYKALAVAMVPHPADKKNVFFLTDPQSGAQVDQNKYPVVKYLIDRIESPFDRWSVELTERRVPHHLYATVQPDAACPCGSGTSYGACCLPNAGVRKPHHQFSFAVAPSDLSDQLYHGGEIQRY